MSCSKVGSGIGVSQKAIAERLEEARAEIEALIEQAHGEKPKMVQLRDDAFLIMDKFGWPECTSEGLISTPRRFGKPVSIALFCACLALALGLEIVVFSPARRASRKLLERIVEFIRLAGGENKIVEYNQVRALSPHTILNSHSHVPLCAPTGGLSAECL